VGVGDRGNTRGVLAGCERTAGTRTSGENVVCRKIMVIDNGKQALRKGNVPRYRQVSR